MGAHQSSPSMILIKLGSVTTVLTEASSMTWKNTSTSMGVLRATAFARSSDSVFLFLSRYSTMNP
jgi:K+-transporting ATPase A subunit